MKRECQYTFTTELERCDPALPLPMRIGWAWSSGAGIGRVHDTREQALMEMVQAAISGEMWSNTLLELFEHEGRRFSVEHDAYVRYRGTVQS